MGSISDFNFFWKVWYRLFRPIRPQIRSHQTLQMSRFQTCVWMLSDIPLLCCSSISKPCAGTKICTCSTVSVIYLPPTLSLSKLVLTLMQKLQQAQINPKLAFNCEFTLQHTNRGVVLSMTYTDFYDPLRVCVWYRWIYVQYDDIGAHWQCHRCCQRRQKKWELLMRYLPVQGRDNIGWWGVELTLDNAG